MRGTTLPWLLVCALALACNAPPPTEGPGAGAAPAAHADQEVLIATVPAGADVLLSGAKVGVTPFKMLVRGNTNILLEKAGYVRQAVLITPESEPNLVVELVADPSRGADEAVERDEDGDDGVGAADRKTARAKTGGGKAPSAGEEPAAEPEAPETNKAEPAPVQKAKAKAYDNMTDLKRDLRAGLITDADYRRWQQDIRERRAEELNKLKADLAAGKVTKAEYEARARQIKLKYEGK
jgi:hypothetical protein